MLEAYRIYVVVLLAACALGSEVRAQDAFKSGTGSIDWSGVQVGVSAGWRWAGRDQAPDISYYEALGPYGLILAGDTPGTQYGDRDGATLSAAIGYRKQFSNVVLGGDLDLEYADLGGRRKAQSTFWYNTPDPTVLPPFGPFTAGGNELSERWIGRARVHVGMAFERWLLFVAGGAAYRFGDKTMESYVAFPGGALAFSDTSRADPWGWVLGAGIEYSVTDALSVKLEYMHTGFAATNYVDPIASAVLNTPATYKVDRDLDSVRVGLTYRFRTD